jgi:hypothetical protein
VLLVEPLEHEVADRVVEELRRVQRVIVRRRQRLAFRGVLGLQPLLCFGRARTCDAVRVGRTDDPLVRGVNIGAGNGYVIATNGMPRDGD